MSFLILFSFLTFTGSDCGEPDPPPKQTPEYTYIWTIDTLFFDLPDLRPPARYWVQSIWGASSKDVWAVSPSDVPWGELWHYDGKKWHSIKWPWVDTDEIGLYGGYIYSTIGFNSTNVFFFGTHRYSDSAGTAAVLKWNGVNWNDVPWKDGKRTTGGLGWGIKQNNNKLWAIVATGVVIKYEDGLLSPEPLFSNYHLASPVIAALDNGEVYVNPYKDSIYDEQLRGSITKLYKRDLSGFWKLIENKFIAGDYFDDNGLGRGVFSYNNHLLTENNGIWERLDSTWIKRKNLYALGGWCFTSENDLWVAFKHELYRYDGKSWEFVAIPLLLNFPDYALYGQGWSNESDIFLGLQNGTKSFILHGKKVLKSNN